MMDQSDGELEEQDLELDEGQERVFSKYGEKSSAMPVKVRQTRAGNYGKNVVEPAIAKKLENSNKHKKKHSSCVAIPYEETL